MRSREIRRSVSKRITCDSNSRASRLTESKNQITSLAMIRKKLPSATALDARASCAVAASAQRSGTRLREFAKCAQRQRFLVQPTDLPAAGVISSVSCGTPMEALAKRFARQVLPRGRQKAPRKCLKNHEESSPGFVAHRVQRIESRSASGHGIGVGEWG